MPPLKREKDSERDGDWVGWQAGRETDLSINSNKTHSLTRPAFRHKQKGKELVWVLIGVADGAWVCTLPSPFRQALLFSHSIPSICRTRLCRPAHSEHTLPHLLMHTHTVTCWWSMSKNTFLKAVIVFHNNSHQLLREQYSIQEQPIIGSWARDG